MEAGVMSVTKTDRDSYWKMMHKYVGSDVTSMVTLSVLIFEPMTMLQKMAETYATMRAISDIMVIGCSIMGISVYHAYQRTWKPFNPIPGKTYELVNHGGNTFISEKVSHHPPTSAGHAENEHFTYDVTSKLKTKFLGNSLDVYLVGRFIVQNGAGSASMGLEAKYLLIVFLSCTQDACDP
ncbi:hypothetical protein HHK36_011023 [Tetracentron sinense]|uniref:Uncharacterized protein n=1 Tax=Tetracentron sinense TaxID=13715 RepID=A0A834ZBP0_TETSI|nr:hypothetical protein HHK36_011023 [Tetracentron sinense]